LGSCFNSNSKKLVSRETSAAKQSQLSKSVIFSRKTELNLESEIPEAKIIETEASQENDAYS